MKKPTLTVLEDNTDFFKKVIASYKNDAVLVGIPQEETKRKEDTPINNATIMAINEFGSPLNNIPPRPVMSIGIRKAQDEIAEQFKLVVQNTFSDGLSALNIYYNRAGIIASNSIKKVINSQEGIEPPKASTLATRKSQGFVGKKSLLVTGQLRNSITYVVKGDKS